MATPKTLLLSKHQLDWLSQHLKEIENSSVYINQTKFEFETNLGDSTSFVTAQRADVDGDILPHVILKVLV